MEKTITNNVLHDFASYKVQTIPSLCEKKQQYDEFLCGICEIAKEVGKHEGIALIVGGFVRDRMMFPKNPNTTTKDLDLEVFGIPFPLLKNILSEFGEINVVGEQFRVMKLGEIDISIPRTESKTRPGHKGFIVEGNPYLSFKDASKRRDFTINALALNPLTGEVFDAHQGIEDIQRGILRAVDAVTFADDPLRPLRAMQFAARFHFSVDPKTASLCKKINLKELPSERIGEEWKKMLLLSNKPSEGLKVARELGIIEQLHPELEAIIGVPQNPAFHPEGDVWIHTLQALDAAAKEIHEEHLHNETALIILLAALLHDIGKATTTIKREGKLTSYNHEKEGIKLAQAFMKSIHVPKRLQQHIVKIIENHTFLLSTNNPTDSAVRRLARRLYPANIEELVWVMNADFAGKGTNPMKNTQAEELLKQALRLNVEKSTPKPIIDGKYLLEIGIQPGKEMGRILDELYEQQLEGKITSIQEGMNYLEKHPRLKEKRGAVSNLPK